MNGTPVPVGRRRPNLPSLIRGYAPHFVWVNSRSIPATYLKEFTHKFGLDSGPDNRLVSTQKYEEDRLSYLDTVQATTESRPKIAPLYNYQFYSPLLPLVLPTPGAVYRSSVLAVATDSAKLVPESDIKIQAFEKKENVVVAPFRRH